MEWDKGCALNYLLDTLGLGASSDVLPIYIGDDRTDEDAFEVTLFSSLTTSNQYMYKKTYFQNLN